MKAEFDRLRGLAEDRLSSFFTGDVPYSVLTESMRYSLMAGGKRIRPVLVLAFCRACGGDEAAVLDAACAVEMLHTYSLIHDDLPCMDDDDLRRGRPTNHKVYGECTATLAGDALQAAAFGALLGCPLPPERLVKMASILAEAAGPAGICGGQTLDMLGEGKALTEDEISLINDLKTASLLSACARIGVAAAGGNDVQLRRADKYARALGLAFQIRDDILDVTSTAEVLGKPIGSDEANSKSTYVTLYGITRCEEIVEEKTAEAVGALSEGFADPSLPVWLAEELAHRVK